MVKTNPQEYKKKHGNILLEPDKMPAWVRELDKEIGYEEYYKMHHSHYVLEGDVYALDLVDDKDLEREGLLDYRRNVKDNQYDLMYF